MPTARPFSDQARPDPEGNAVPYDSAPAEELLQGEYPSGLPVALVSEAAIDLHPLRLGGAMTLFGRVAPFDEPRQLLPADPRRAAVTVYAAGADAALDGVFLVGRTRDDVLREDTSLRMAVTALFGVPVPPPARFCWPEPLWAVQIAGAAANRLCVLTELWSR